MPAADNIYERMAEIILAETVGAFVNYNLARVRFDSCSNVSEGESGGRFD